MKKWKSWRPEYAKTKFDVIIIGSGISGLTAGVLLSEQGKKVLQLYIDQNGQVYNATR